MSVRSFYIALLAAAVAACSVQSDEKCEGNVRDNKGAAFGGGANRNAWWTDWAGRR